MPPAGDRLKIARELAGYETAADAADALDIAYPTYSQHERSDRLPVEAGHRYADFFKVNFEWLMLGRGPMKRNQPDPLLDLYLGLPPTKQEQAIEFLKFLQDQSE